MVSCQRHSDSPAVSAPPPGAPNTKMQNRPATQNTTKNRRIWVRWGFFSEQRQILTWQIFFREGKFLKDFRKSVRASREAARPRHRALGWPTSMRKKWISIKLSPSPPPQQCSDTPEIHTEPHLSSSSPRAYNECQGMWDVLWSATDLGTNDKAPLLILIRGGA